MAVDFLERQHFGVDHRPFADRHRAGLGMEQADDDRATGPLQRGEGQPGGEAEGGKGRHRQPGGGARPRRVGGRDGGVRCWGHELDRAGWRGIGRRARPPLQSLSIFPDRATKRRKNRIYRQIFRPDRRRA